MIINGFVPSSEIFSTSLNAKGINSSEKSGNGESFANTLVNALQDINDQQIKADNMTAEFVKGGDVDISQVMLAGEEAKISLQFAIEIRNKLVDAYNQLSQTQL